MVGGPGYFQRIPQFAKDALEINEIPKSQIKSEGDDPGTALMVVWAQRERKRSGRIVCTGGASDQLSNVKPAKFFETPLLSENAPQLRGQRRSEGLVAKRTHHEKGRFCPPKVTVRIPCTVFRAEDVRTPFIVFRAEDL